jgi:hypothetical protein
MPSNPDYHSNISLLRCTTGNVDISRIVLSMWRLLPTRLVIEMHTLEPRHLQIDLSVRGATNHFGDQDFDIAAEMY